jgi:hypothetical protein
MARLSPVVDKRGSETFRDVACNVSGVKKVGF